MVSKQKELSAKSAIGVNNGRKAVNEDEKEGENGKQI